MLLSLDQLIRDPAIHQRARGVNPVIVRQYAKAMQTGARFPPLVVFYDRLTDTWSLADGFHRYDAAVLAGYTSVDVTVHMGTRRDAILYACGANADHGIRRNNKEKHQVVQCYLTDPTLATMSDRAIARQTHTTQPFVSKLRHVLARTTTAD